MAYDQRSSFVIGCVLLICGTSSIILGCIILVFVSNSEYTYTFAPVWSGIVVIITGVFGVVAGKRKHFPSKCTIIFIVILNIITLMASLISWVISILRILESASKNNAKISRALFAMILMVGVIEMLLALCTVVMYLSGVCCYRHITKPVCQSNHCQESSSNESGDFYTLQAGDQVIEAADGDIVIVSGSHVIHPGTKKIKIVGRESTSIPPPYGFGSIPASDILEPELPVYTSVENENIPSTSHGVVESTCPDLLTKQPPSDFVEVEDSQLFGALE
ncbi:uncharacterized protein LOC100376432 [Saccoglossus kowalevskii]|uniref:Uncharacterized protein LOC100376432 n=1 Tax=Saccoglossus kowalevskii TaxID=10224 RepID=A0ABM0GU84_SACKO|nr:PREDICTED: uncharacterized protein LOC100376432 [Saccoglossus kowalevskii]